MRQLVVLAICTVATLLSSSFAQATIRITSDQGGRLIDYVERFNRARASGERVIIDGTCLSACTLVVGMLPRDQLCATPRAVLGFHAGSNANATRGMMELYPANLREWINHHGGLAQRVIFLRGRELSAIMPTCAAVSAHP